MGLFSFIKERVTEFNDDIENRKKKMERYSDKELLRHYQRSTGKERIAALSLLKERGIDVNNS